MRVVLKVTGHCATLSSLHGRKSDCLFLLFLVSLLNWGQNDTEGRRERRGGERRGRRQTLKQKHSLFTPIVSQFPPTHLSLLALEKQKQWAHSQDSQKKKKNIFRPRDLNISYPPVRPPVRRGCFSLFSSLNALLSFHFLLLLLPSFSRRLRFLLLLPPPPFCLDN